MLKDNAETTPPLGRFRIQRRGFLEVPCRLGKYCLRGHKSVLSMSGMYFDVSHQLLSQPQLPSGHTDSDQFGKRLGPVEGWRLTCCGSELLDTSDCRVNVAPGELDQSSNGKDSCEDLEVADSAGTRKQLVNQQGGLGQAAPPDQDKGFGSLAKYCRMEVRAWLGAGWWGLVLPGGGVGEVQPAGAVQGFFRGAGV
jgi:hypothetical protein